MRFGSVVSWLCATDWRIFASVPKPIHSHYPHCRCDKLRTTIEAWKWSSNCFFVILIYWWFNKYLQEVLLLRLACHFPQQFNTWTRDFSCSWIYLNPPEPICYHSFAHVEKDETTTLVLKKTFSDLNDVPRQMHHNNPITTKFQNSVFPF